MKKSLQAFMKGIIDYAGLFPPADLSLDTAIQNYAQYKAEADAWMLSRFIIPASRLNELEPYADSLFTKDSPFDFSVLGKGTQMIDEYHEEIRAVLDSCAGFCADYSGTVTTDMLEMKLPKEAALSHDVDLLRQLMDQTGAALQRESTPRVIFYEGSFNDGWKKDIEAIIQAISQHNEDINKAAGNYRYAAFKVRCGGVEEHHFPSVEQVAFVLQKAREHNVAIKGTAGLHHPMRHYAELVQTKMHGFFNVFGGAMLGYANGLCDNEIKEILNEEDAEQFNFSDDGLSWKDYHISTKEIEDLRKVALLSYGSCSFDEPREDLKKLNLF